MLTGTSLGDPIEVGAAATLFTAHAPASDPATGRLPFLWASVKGYTGHQEAASGQ